MTHNKNFKKLVKDHAKKTGKAYTAALRDFANEAANTLPRKEEGSQSLPGSSVAQDLLVRLQSSPFGVSVGRVPAVAGSANLAIAQAHAHDLATHPKFFAESGLVEMIISPAELDALVAAGAARAPEVQVIRSFENNHGATFSEDCHTCRRWIWCGDTEHEATCACGQIYRVVFDLAPRYHWTRAAGPRA